MSFDSQNNNYQLYEQPNEDVLTVILDIENKYVQHMLMYDGSSSHILFSHVLRIMDTIGHKVTINHFPQTLILIHVHLEYHPSISSSFTFTIQLTNNTNKIRNK